MPGQRLRSFVVSGAACFAISCYSPDLTQQVYKCDRGKCPEGLYCNDSAYCTQQLSQCLVGGIEMMPGIALCIGMGTVPGSSTMSICGASAASTNCDMSLIKPELCANLTNCAFCCNK